MNAALTHSYTGRAISAVKAPKSSICHTTTVGGQTKSSIGHTTTVGGQTTTVGGQITGFGTSKKNITCDIYSQIN